jgi:hypothetical protein
MTWKGAVPWWTVVYPLMEMHVRPYVSAHLNVGSLTLQFVSRGT